MVFTAKGTFVIELIVQIAHLLKLIFYSMCKFSNWKQNLETHHFENHRIKSFKCFMILCYGVESM